MIKARRIAVKILKVKMALFKGWLNIDQWYALTKEVGWVNNHFWLDPTSQTIAKSLFPKLLTETILQTVFEVKQKGFWHLDS